MSKVNYYNKGLLKGSVSKSEIVTYKGKGGKPDGSFLSLEIDCAGSKIKTGVFPTKANANKHTDFQTLYPVGTLVEINGSVQEKEFTSGTGKVGIERSVSTISIKPLEDVTKKGASFFIQGIVEMVRPISGGVMVRVSYVETYDNAEGVKVTKEPALFTLQGNEDIAELVSDLDVIKGCNAKFKGKIMNALEFDDYGDVIGNVQMFSIERIENVVQPSDLEEEEEMPFDI